jgi:hypothetical protein
MGRLQLQEQRVNTLLRRLDEIRQSRVTAEREAANHQSALTEMEESLPRTTDPMERQQGELHIRDLKLMLNRSSADIQRLRVEETELAGITAVEQRRWTEINDQLEDLDRTLRRQ